MFHILQVLQVLSCIIQEIRFSQFSNEFSCLRVIPKLKQRLLNLLSFFLRLVNQNCSNPSYHILNSVLLLLNLLEWVIKLNVVSNLSIVSCFNLVYRAYHWYFLKLLIFLDHFMIECFVIIFDSTNTHLRSLITISNTTVWLLLLPVRMRFKC
jgi:hypothetical protein